MKIPVCIIKRYTYDENTNKYSTDVTPINSFSSVTINYGYKDKKDTFTITLVTKKEFNSVTQSDIYTVPNIDNNDIINIYTYYEDDPNIVYAADGVTVSNLDDFLLFNGVVDKFNYTSNQGKYSLTINGNNRTEILLNSMVFFQYSKMRVPDMIAEVAGKFRSMNKNKPLFMFKDYKGDGTDIPGSMPGAFDAHNNDLFGTLIPGYENWGFVPIGGIRAYKAEAYEKYGSIWRLKSNIDLNELLDDGKTFRYKMPELQYYETYKTLYSHLDVLSGKSFTGDSLGGTYITFIGRDNVLQWKPKQTEISGTASERDTTSTTVNREIRDVINAVIVNVGNDAKSKGILALAYNTSSMIKYGAKWKYMAKTNISEQIMNDQKVLSNVSYNENDNFPASYPVDVEVPGESSIIDSDTGSPIWKYTTTDKLYNNGDFNRYIRRIAREAGKAFGRDFTALNSNPRFFLQMNLELGNTLFEVGDFINVDVPSVNWTDLQSKNLRVQEIKHTINQNGWNTSLTLEEDTEAL